MCLNTALTLFIPPLTADMSVEGVFRKNGNIRRLKELSETIDKDPGVVNLSEENPVQVAALLKKFLRDLPDPLLTFKLHRLFVVSQSECFFLTFFSRSLDVRAFVFLDVLIL